MTNKLQMIRKDADQTIQFIARGKRDRLVQRSDYAVNAFVDRVIAEVKRGALPDMRGNQLSPYIEIDGRLFAR